MKGKIPVILALLVSLASPAAAATAAPKITVEEEGRLIDTTSSPVIMHNNQPYVSLQLLAQSLGYEVKWDAKNATYHLSVANAKYPLILNESAQFVSVEPKYNIMTSLDSSRLLGGINLDFVYVIEKDLPREPVLVVEMLNKDQTVLASSTKLLKKTKGTFKDYILGDSIRLPYPVQTNREQVTKLMSEDYTYRIKIK
ncbi:stalk domain-containing protein [Brevibacillus choshinensis]|uniref:Copper amine oxidase-like N-terminal domain-containing protein n=1 Tax=Brevibacillus choshinensis TaxID=54911 RepID=A0ABX7FJQ4_BRECH|nr:stalk domain-containing protein [Brevibacillus choshinensis]QRG65864.1 hypothetical protein JNE38_20065 [Brevibacillus choshinensis]